MTIIDKPIAHTSDGRPLFDNTPTVVVVLAVIDRKLIAVRRNNQPGKGLIGLPGGYHMRGETWQEAGVREVFEETGYVINPLHLRVQSLVTDKYGNNLITSIASFVHPLRGAEPDPEEVQAVLLLDHAGAPEHWAFPLHYQAAHQLLRDLRN